MTGESGRQWHGGGSGEDVFVGWVHPEGGVQFPQVRRGLACVAHPGRPRRIPFLGP